MSITYQKEIKYKLKFVFITEDLEEVIVYPISEHSDHGYYDYLEPTSELWWLEHHVLIDDLERGGFSIILSSFDYLFGGEIIDQKAIALKVYYEKIEKVTSLWRRVDGKLKITHERDILLETHHLKTIKRPE